MGAAIFIQWSFPKCMYLQFTCSEIKNRGQYLMNAEHSKVMLKVKTSCITRFVLDGWFLKNFPKFFWVPPFHFNLSDQRYSYTGWKIKSHGQYLINGRIFETKATTILYYQICYGGLIFKKISKIFLGTALPLTFRHSKIFICRLKDKSSRQGCKSVSSIGGMISIFWWLFWYWGDDLKNFFFDDLFFARHAFFSPFFVKIQLLGGMFPPIPPEFAALHRGKYLINDRTFKTNIRLKSSCIVVVVNTLVLKSWFLKISFPLNTRITIRLTFVNNFALYKNLNLESRIRDPGYTTANFYSKSYVIC